MATMIDDGLLSSGCLHSRDAIMQAFENAVHTTTSKAVFNGIKDGTLKVKFRKFGGSGCSAGGWMFVNRTMKMDDVLTILVHEGRHQLDKAAGIIPFENPGGGVSVFSEMRAWSSSSNFAVKNGFLNRHSEQAGNWNAPREFAIEIGTSPNYLGQFGDLSDDDLWHAIELFDFTMR